MPSKPVVQLVLAPNTYNPTRSSACFPPLGLISIGTRLQQDGIQIEILDGELLSRDQIADRLHAEFVGFTVNMLNNRFAIDLAEVAKQKGAIVVWGGPHASQRWRQILANRSFVDYVCVGDGEEAMAQLLQGKDPDMIANLATRGHKPQRVEAAADSMPMPDYRLVDTEVYIRNFQHQTNSPGLRVLNFYTHKGCAFRAGYCRPRKGICVFCSIIDRGFRNKTIPRIVREVEYYTKTYQLTHLRDVGDSITGDKEWLKDLASALNGWGPKLYVYARSDEITDEIAETLAKMNVELVALGIESGDDETLRRAGKQETAGQAFQAVRSLGKAGIKVRTSFVLGLPGESPASIARTRELISRFLAEENVTYIPMSRLLPLPGAPLFHRLEAKFQYLKSLDYFDLEELRKLWVRNFTDVSPEYLEEVEAEIKASHPAKFSIGIGDHKKE